MVRPAVRRGFKYLPRGADARHDTTYVVVACACTAAHVHDFNSDADHVYEASCGRVYTVVLMSADERKAITCGKVPVQGVRKGATCGRKTAGTMWWGCYWHGNLHGVAS